MIKDLVHTPKLPIRLTIGLLILCLFELVLYGMFAGVPGIWFLVLVAGFFLVYFSFFRHDTLPLAFTILFLTAHHILVFYNNRELPISLVFVVIFILQSAAMWILLHYATHLKREYHIAYSLITGFMMAEILTLFASMIRDWPFRFELAAYMTTLFSYIVWRFACLSAEAMLGWKQFFRLAWLVAILVIIMSIGSPQLSV